MLYNKQLERNLRVCTKCGHHFRLRADARLRLLLDPDSFEERDAGLESTDPLGFVDLKPYPDRLVAARIASGLRDAAVWGTGRIDGQPVAICVMDFAFIGGSMGSVVGEKVTRAAEHALATSMPLVIVSASGGARMQEGTLALMQLAKTCAALERLAAAGVPYVSIMTDPTTGGVFASFSVLGDVNLAEPDALIRFAGERVASGTISVELPPGYQRAEFLLEHGFLDRVVPRDHLREEVARVLCYLREGAPCSDAPFPPGTPLARAAVEGRDAAFRPFGFFNPKLAGPADGRGRPAWRGGHRCAGRRDRRARRRADRGARAGGRRGRQDHTAGRHPAVAGRHRRWGSSRSDRRTAERRQRKRCRAGAFHRAFDRDPGLRPAPTPAPRAAPGLRLPRRPAPPRAGTRRSHRRPPTPPNRSASGHACRRRAT